jgi:hypothetical protein
VGPGLGAAGPGEHPLGARDGLPHVLGQLAEVEQPSGSQPQRIEARLGGVWGEHQQRAGVGGVQPSL